MTPYQIALKVLLSPEGRDAVSKLVMVVVGLVLVLGAGGAMFLGGLFGHRTIPGHPVPSPGLVVGLPDGAMEFWNVYVDAAEVFSVSPFLLMAVHEDESAFSRGSQDGVGDGVNFAGCCAGPMQFLITGAATPAQGGTGGTWGARVNGASLKDAFRRANIERPAAYPLRFEQPHPNVYDSFDAIYAAAMYLQYLGAGPELDDRTFQALLRYKGTPPASIPFAQADLDRARELAGIYAENGAFTPTAPTGETVLANRPDDWLRRTRDGWEPNLSKWLAPVPGFPGERCDRRIIDDLLYLIEQYRLILTDCYSIEGVHRSFGEHPLGLAADLVPAPNGSWALVGALARWAEPTQNLPRTPFRWVGYNGDVDHGDPGHTSTPHLHLSWLHAPTPWNHPAEWVTVWR